MALAQTTYYWSGEGANNNWSTAANWVDNTVPVVAVGNAAYFGASANYTVNRSSTTNAINQLIFGEDAGAYTFTGERFRLQATSSDVGLIANYSSHTHDVPPKFDPPAMREWVGLWGE